MEKQSTKRLKHHIVSDKISSVAPALGHPSLYLSFVLGLNIINNHSASMKSRYQLNSDEELQQGFCRPQLEPQEVFLPPAHNQYHYDVFHSIQPTSLHRKAKHYPSQKHNLKLETLQHVHGHGNPLSKHFNALSMIHNRIQQTELGRFHEEENRSLILKQRRKMERDRSLSKFSEETEIVVFRTKRTEIGEDLVIKNDSQIQEQIIKEQPKPSCVVYQGKAANSTHAFFRSLTQLHGSSFLDSKYNSGIKKKMERFRAKKEERQMNKQSDIEFVGDFESGNLDLAFRVAQNQYNLYLRIDTHTKGHQSWFYFKVINHCNHNNEIKVNICNLKKKFKMIQKGQKLFIKSHGHWRVLNEEVTASTVRKGVYQLSVSLKLKEKQEVYLSLIAPYTYSQLLEQIEVYDQSPHVKVQILTYSVSGLAIPILTITKNAKLSKPDPNKKLFLISGRIHPSQTCSSFVISGLINELLSNKPEMEDLLNTTVIKIIPMLNPDGVVFGNFRTSYLGDDLNRSFHQSDDTLYPEVTALKEIVKTCRRQFQDNFLAFIDLHGHSSRTNSFVYGPEFQPDSEQFVECRVFPKILDKVSKYFSYELSSFKLEEYKYNTARGYFLRRLKVPSYTIQTSYALFQQKTLDSSIYKEMSIHEWNELGKQLALSLHLFSEYSFNARKNMTNIVFKNRQKERRSQHKKTQMNVASVQASGSQVSFGDVRKEIQRQIQLSSKITLVDPNSSDSDGEGLEQDLPLKQKQILLKKVREIVYPSLSNSKVMKPAMILPAIVPSIVVVAKKQYIAPKMPSKVRPKKFARPLNFNNEYTDYLLKNVNALNSLRPDIINFSNLMRNKLKEAEQAHRQEEK